MSDTITARLVPDDGEAFDIEASEALDSCGVILHEGRLYSYAYTSGRLLVFQERLIYDAASRSAHPFGDLK